MSPSSLQLDLRKLIMISYFHSPSKIRCSGRATCRQCEKTTSWGIGRGDSGRGRPDGDLSGLTLPSSALEYRNLGNVRQSTIRPLLRTLQKTSEEIQGELTSKFVKKQLSLGGVE
ncbi:hypothetical protein ACTXT7_004337 [Hymenolepis weldensis]